MGLINKKDRKSRDYYLCVHAYMFMLSVAYRPSKRTELSYVAVTALQFGGELAAFSCTSYILQEKWEMYIE